MQTKTIGILLMIVGIIMMVYTGFNYVSTETVVDLGPLQVEAKKNNFVKLSPILGGILMVVGIILLFRSKKSV
ncbi:MAG: hypothetical protein IPH93_05670 [Saprospiraceae bacterium]|nr:hypothetical protein [Saprospiraceae bacterium]MBK7811567.1 hypothetical protein [Saprospiraceae bacterium]MBK9631723.1 hypothetical protein [Saprospiraceae bacterium]